MTGGADTHLAGGGQGAGPLPWVAVGDVRGGHGGTVLSASGTLYRPGGQAVRQTRLLEQTESTAYTGAGL